MAEQVIRRRVDDLERQRGNLDVAADEEIVFGIDGATYVIDLSAQHAQDLRATLVEYVTAARPLIDVEARKDLSPNQAKRQELADVRSWAAREGLRVSSRGKVPSHVLEAFERSVGPLKHQ